MLHKSNILSACVWWLRPCNYKVFVLWLSKTQSEGLCLSSGIARLLLEGNQYEDPSQSAGSFRQVFQQRYGPHGLNFTETGWEEAAAQAHRQYKFLLVYLHAAEHQVQYTNYRFHPNDNIDVTMPFFLGQSYHGWHSHTGRWNACILQRTRWKTQDTNVVCPLCRSDQL